MRSMSSSIRWLSSQSKSIFVTLPISPPPSYTWCVLYHVLGFILPSPRSILVLYAMHYITLSSLYPSLYAYNMIYPSLYAYYMIYPSLYAYYIDLSFPICVLYDLSFPLLLGQSPLYLHSILGYDFWRSVTMSSVYSITLLPCTYWLYHLIYNCVCW